MHQMQLRAWVVLSKQGTARHRDLIDRARSAFDCGLIVLEPAILGGDPCIRGTRISMQMVLELLANGAS